MTSAHLPRPSPAQRGHLLILTVGETVREHPWRSVYEANAVTTQEIVKLVHRFGAYRDTFLGNLHHIYVP